MKTVLAGTHEKKGKPWALPRGVVPLHANHAKNADFLKGFQPKDKFDCEIAALLLFPMKENTADILRAFPEINSGRSTDPKSAGRLRDWPGDAAMAGRLLEKASECRLGKNAGVEDFLKALEKCADAFPETSVFSRKMHMLPECAKSIDALFSECESRSGGKVPQSRLHADLAEGKLHLRIAESILQIGQRKCSKDWLWAFVPRYMQKIFEDGGIDEGNFRSKLLEIGYGGKKRTLSELKGAGKGTLPKIINLARAACLMLTEEGNSGELADFGEEKKLKFEFPEALDRRLAKKLDMRHYTPHFFAKKYREIGRPGISSMLRIGGSFSEAEIRAVDNLIRMMMERLPEDEKKNWPEGKPGHVRGDAKAIKEMNRKLSVQITGGWSP